MNGKSLHAVMCSTAVFFLATNFLYADVIYDAFEDFSIATNPNGVWRYGYISNNLFVPASSNASSGQVIAWRGGLGSDGSPLIAKNITGSGFQSGTVSWPAAALVMQPGPEGEKSTLQFMTPRTGSYTISVYFAAADSTSTDVHIFVNGTSIFDSYINLLGAGSSTFYNTTTPRMLTGADIVSIRVGDGGNGNKNDSTAVTVKITAISPVNAPEGLINVALGSALFVIARLTSSVRGSRRLSS